MSEKASQPTTTVAPEKPGTAALEVETGGQEYAPPTPGVELGGAEPPPIQRSVENLQKLGSSNARQKVMQAIQRRYGNQYAGQVASGFSKIQRTTLASLPASPARLPEPGNLASSVQRRWQSSLDRLPAHPPTGLLSVRPPSLSNSTVVQRDTAAPPAPAPTEEKKPPSISFSSYNGTWIDEAPDGKSTEMSNGLRTAWETTNDKNNAKLNYNDGDWATTKNPGSVTDKDVTTEATSLNTGNGTRTAYSASTTQTGPDQNIITSKNNETFTQGQWNDSDKKNITYGSTSQEHKTDFRTGEVSDSSRGGTGILQQSSNSVENKTPDGNITVTDSNSRTGQIGTWNENSNKTTRFGADNLDKKVNETSSNTASGEGLKAQASQSNVIKTVGTEGTTTVTNAASNSLTDGSWREKSNKTTVYTGDRARTETNITNNSATGLKTQYEKSQETKYAAAGTDRSGNYTTKSTFKDNTFNGSWDETSTKRKQEGSHTETSTTNKTGSGLRRDDSQTDTREYVDDKGRDRTNTTTLSHTYQKGTETTSTNSSSSNLSGYTASTRNNTFTGQRWGVDYKKELNRPKDQQTAPAPVKYQEGVLIKKAITPSYDTSIDYSNGHGFKNGDAKTDDHSSQGTYHAGTWERGGSSYQVTTRNTSVSGNVGVGAGLTGQTSRTDKAHLGAATITNTASASGTLGATADASGTAAFGLDGLNLGGKASVFVGAKVDLSNSTTAELGRAAINATLSASGSAGVGANANAALGITSEGLNATGSADAFVGVKGSIGASGTAGYGGHNFITGSYTLEGSAGAGASANGTFSIDWATGTVSLGAGAAATLGIGGGGSGAVTVNFSEMALAGEAAAEDAYNAVDSDCCGRVLINSMAYGPRQIARAGRAIGHWAGGVKDRAVALGRVIVGRVQNFIQQHPRVQAAVNAARNVYNGVKNGLTNFGHRIAGAMPAIGQALRRYGPVALAAVAPVAAIGVGAAWLAREGIRRAPEIAHQVGQLARAGVARVQQLGHAIGDGARAGIARIQALGGTIVQGAQRAGQTVLQMGQRVGQGLANAGQFALHTGERIAQGAAAAGQRVLQFGSNLVNSIGQRFPQIMQAGAQLKQFAQQKIQQLGSAGTSVINWAQERVSSARAHLQGLPSLLRSAAEGLLNLAQGVLNRARGAVQAALNAARGLIERASQVAEAAVNAARTAWNNLKARAAQAGQMVQSAWNGIKATAHSIGERVHGVWNGIKATAHSIGERVHGAWENVKARGRALRQSVSNGWNAAVSLAHRAGQAVQGAWNGVKARAAQAGEMIRGVWNSAKELGHRAVERVKGAAHTVAGWARTAGAAIGRAAHTVGGWVHSGIDMARAGWQRVSQTAHNVWNAMPPFIHQAADRAGQLYHAAGDGIHQLGQAAQARLSQLATDARNLIKRTSDSAHSWCNGVNMRVFGTANQLPATTAPGAGPAGQGAQAATPGASGRLSAAALGGGAGASAGLGARAGAGAGAQAHPLAVEATAAAQQQMQALQQQANSTNEQTHAQIQAQANNAEQAGGAIPTEVHGRVEQAVSTAHASNQVYTQQAPAEAQAVQARGEQKQIEAHTQQAEGEQKIAAFHAQTEAANAEIEQAKTHAQTTSTAQQAQVVQAHTAASQLTQSHAAQAQQAQTTAHSHVEAASTELHQAHTASLQLTEAAQAQVSAAEATGHNATSAAQTEVATHEARGQQIAEASHGQLEQAHAQTQQAMTTHAEQVSQQHQNTEQQASEHLAQINSAR